MQHGRPLAYFDVTALRAHGQRGIGRYIACLLEAFGSVGALGSLVTTDDKQRSQVPIVHVPVVSSRRTDSVATGQLLVGTVFDLTPLRFPSDVFRPWQLAQMSRYVRQLRALRRCSHLVAISESTARDARRFLRLDALRLSVISLGVTPLSCRADRPTARSASRPRILYVGAASRHKNLPRLLEAHSLMSHDTAELIIAGLITPRQASRLQTTAARLGTAGRVVLRGAVDEEELWRLYASADVLALPSLWEGFGLPALEAMAAGLPVVCSNRSALPEVVGNCARLIDPRSPSDLASQLDLVLDRADLAAEMRRCGMSRASDFSWNCAAQAHVDLYRTLASAA